MKTMGLDFGLKRIGIALSDETKFLASPYLTYHRKEEQADLEYLLSIIEKEHVDEIVCGLPMNMAGEEQTIASQTREFMSKLYTLCKIEIKYEDERLSSSMAEDILKMREKDWKKRKKKLDSVAATIILQDYLDSKIK